MKRLQIKKLIVVSKSEKNSLEAEFGEGLNIVIGKNKTGKSSIIKSIFYAFGCELLRVESEWKNLITDYVVYFIVNEQEYCIYRTGKNFRLCKIDGNDFKLLLSTDKFHEYSNILMEILDVNLPCIDKKGQNHFNATPSLLFRLQYIDQDTGWNKIGEQFSNLKYINNWQSYSNKYTVGYFNNEYFELKNTIDLMKQGKKELDNKFNANQEFVNKIEIMVPPKIGENTTVEIELEKLILTINQKTLDVIELQNQIGKLMNLDHVLQRKIELLNYNREETEKDIEYAKELDSTVVCPTCGTAHDNALSNQMILSLDIASAENMIEMLWQEKLESIEEIKKLESLYKERESDLRGLRNELIKIKHISKYEEILKSEGKNEFYESCLKEIEILVNELESIATKIVVKEENLKKMASRKRSNDIKNKIITYCSKVAEKINISTNFIKLKDFVQVLNKTGSEAPRLIYMYYVGLYLYNLDRDRSPFNFLVIDTPNQQGQDSKNLQGIFDSIELLQDKKGQTILATERETGYENVATNVLRLGQTRKCLNEENFDKHINIIKAIIKLEL